MNVDLGIGIIGTGGMGSDHVRRLARRVTGAHPVRLYDADAARAAEVAREFDTTALESSSALIADPSVDAVLIACPDKFHFALVMECIDAAKPVSCEKPLAATAAQTAAIIEREVAAARRYVQVGVIRRYDPGYRPLRDVLVSGRIGNPLLVHCVHRNRTRVPYWTSEMSIMDAAVHEIDVIRWILGEEYISGQAVAGRQNRGNGSQVKDPQLIYLETTSGVRIDVESNMSSGYGYDIQCEVVGETGVVRLSDPNALETRMDGTRAGQMHLGFG